MKAVFLMVLIALQIPLHAQQRYIVLLQDSQMRAPNGALLPIYRGDYLKFAGRDNSQIFYTVDGIGQDRITWNQVSVVAETPDALKRYQETEERLKNQYALEIPPVTSDPRDRRWYESERKIESEVMEHVFQSGLFAVAIKPAHLRGEWELEIGEAFPFLGFQGNTARLGLGNEYLEAPRENVAIVTLSEHPELADRYKKILATENERRARENQEQSLQDIKDQLEAIRGMQSLQWHFYGK